MSWKEADIVKLRKQFIEEHLDQNHDSFTALCDGYGISRKTGYKWVDRFMNGGFNNLADSTAGLILERAGLVKPRKKRWTVPADEQAFCDTQENNQVWGVDYKGQFKLGNGNLCYPLTITDNNARYLLRCQALKALAL